MPDQADTPISALVLPVEAAGSSEAQTIAGFPGRWTPGVPYAVSALGMTDDEARAVLAKVDTPLVWTEVPPEEAQHVFLRAPGSHAPSGYMDVEADRLADSRRRAEPIANEQGDVVHAGVLPPVKDANPSWVRDMIDRDTSLSRGKSPDDARVRYAKAAIEEQIAGEKKDQLVARAEALGVDHAGLKADELRAVVLEHELAAFDLATASPATTIVEVQEELDPNARPEDQETDLLGVPAAPTEETE